MVICALCRAYTDDQGPVCEHCGAPLQPDRMESVIQSARDPIVAELAKDEQRARLVASAVVAANSAQFFYADKQGRHTVFVDLFGPKLDALSRAAAILVAAYGYLAHEGYCDLVWDAKANYIALTALRTWDAQRTCLERMLAEQALQIGVTTYQASEYVLRELMGFRPVLVRVRGANGRMLRHLPERSAVAALDYITRLTALPTHNRAEGCRLIYQIVTKFVRSNPERARHLALESTRLLETLSTQTPL